MIILGDGAPAPQNKPSETKCRGPIEADSANPFTNY